MSHNEIPAKVTKARGRWAAARARHQDAIALYQKKATTQQALRDALELATKEAELAQATMVKIGDEVGRLQAAYLAAYEAAGLD